MSTRPLSPEEIRNFVLTRTALGRRGYAEEEVDLLLDRIADEAVAAGGYRAELIAENLRLRAELRDRNGVSGAPVPEPDRTCPGQPEVSASVDMAYQCAARVAEYIGGHYAQVCQAAQDHWQDGADPDGPQSQALRTWMAWAQAVLTELETAQSQLVVALETLGRGCVPTARLPQQAQTPMVAAGRQMTRAVE